MTFENAAATVTLSGLAGIEVSATVLPSATTAMVFCPDDLLGTTAALGLSIRVLDGSVGYAGYYHIFANRLKTQLLAYVAQYII